MGQRFGISEIIDSNKFQIRVPQRRTQDVPADPSETINADFYSHVPSDMNLSFRLENPVSFGETRMLTVMCERRQIAISPDNLDFQIFIFAIPKRQSR